MDIDDLKGHIVVLEMAPDQAWSSVDVLHGDGHNDHIYIEKGTSYGPLVVLDTHAQLDPTYENAFMRHMRHELEPQICYTYIDVVLECIECSMSGIIHITWKPAYNASFEHDIVELSQNVHVHVIDDENMDADVLIRVGVERLISTLESKVTHESTVCRGVTK